MSVDARAGAGTLPLPNEFDEVDLVPVRTYWQLVRQRFLRHRLAVIAVVILAMLIAVSIVVPMATGNAYRTSSLTLIDEGPSLTAPLGYDEIGRNIFLRLAKATQTSLIIGFASVIIIAGIGALVGSLAGYFGGWVDNLLMRLVDVVLSLPFLFLVLLIVSFFGIRDIRVIVIAIGIAGWTTAARLVRAEFLQLRETDFVAAGRALGASPRRIIVRHMLPGAMAPLVVAASLGVADAIIGESALSFLGFGIAPPEVSLGQMLQDFREYFFTHSERILYPAVVLVVIVLCASFLGDGLRDALDPRQRVES
ncbi:MAG TPA: ABC transporter permease [Candidatus Saccharimonadales bacterium]|nr:ABC transporter permease [Candidatus Saccharimonadales bacterium]